MIVEQKFGNGFTWINIEAEQLRTETSEIQAKYLDSEIITYALDDYERAFMECSHIKGKEVLTIIFNTIDLKQKESYYETVPMTFCLSHDRLITVTRSRNSYMLELLQKYLDRNPDVSPKKFLFAALTLITKQYFNVVSKIDREKDILNRQLREQTTNKRLLAMSDLETGSVYLLTAANQNALVLEQLDVHPSQRFNSEVEKEQLSDALIEAHQLVSMTQLNSQVLSQLSSTFNNVLNNNLNENLTGLNIISINLAIIAAITGFFGMNIPLPLTESRSSWLIVIATSVLLWVIITQILKRVFNLRK
ncbi:TPA: magnesium transporter CorA family protein [Streptococcus agalactiae]|nr:magnesium transporter CorA family protein [Streptococcus agalactiae]HEO8700585.1 magnesium transporter CorA family protein [Streptococcus agalactiae]